MKSVIQQDLKSLYIPPPDSHKGQNGRVLVIGGSHLFHAASLWALTVASRIVDLVHYCSVEENNILVSKIKEEFRNGIIVSRADVESYIEEDDCILIGPGMTRDGETKKLTDTLLSKFPKKQWVIDAGALQMMDLSTIPTGAILTPHHGEFADLVNRALVADKNLDPSSISGPQAPSAQSLRESESGQNFTGSPYGDSSQVKWFAKKYNCTVILKGPTDIIASPNDVRKVEGGNAGMTKGGTGDVLAGLIAALCCNNDPWLATRAGSYINKKAGDDLYKTVGPYFNATDLANQIPKTMAGLIRNV